MEVSGGTPPSHGTNIIVLRRNSAIKNKYNFFFFFLLLLKQVCWSRDLPYPLLASHNSQTMTIDNKQQEQHQQSLSRAMSMNLPGLSNEQQEQHQQSLSRAMMLTGLPGLSMPGHQTFARRMSREEQRAFLLSTIQLALDITSDVDASSFESPMLVSSTAWHRNSDGSSRDKQ
jgi:hypothetical protein